ncbi:MAG TPA: response regulator [Nitrospiria bacterium]
MGYPRILVIDDEENFLSLVSKVLGKEGYEVRTAVDTTEALKRLEEEPFDLALLDIRMHPIDGLTLLGQIKIRRPHLKVIMVTAYPADQTRTIALLKGAIAYLVKPLDINDLKETVRGHLLPR